MDHDCWVARKINIMSARVNTCIGFKIKMFFQFEDQDGMVYLIWYNYNWFVHSIINPKTDPLNEKRNPEVLGQRKSSITKEKRFLPQWNPNRVKEGM